MSSPISFHKQALVTISGPAGSGKSHCALRLAEFFDMPCHSSGSIFRSMASERKITIAELSKLAERDSAIDREIDRRTEEYAMKGGCILEGRLVSWFSKSSTKLSIYIAAPFEVRVKRIAERDGITYEEAAKKTRAREMSESKRYRSIYGIDIADLTAYDFVINTTLWDKDAVVELLKSIISLYIKTLQA